MNNMSMNKDDIINHDNDTDNNDDSNTDNNDNSTNGNHKGKDSFDTIPTPYAV